MAEKTTGVLEVNGAKIAYEVAGEGRPVVFIHAGVADQRMWDDQFDLFAEKYRVVRYDTRGYGKTTSEAVEYSNRADLRALLDHLGIDRAILIGCSRGGQIATDVTLESPERVAALITVGSGPGGYDIEQSPEEEARWAALEQREEAYIAAGDYESVIQMDIEVWLAGFPRSVDDMPAPLVQRMVEMGRANYSHADEGAKAIPLDPPGAGRLGEIRVPALILWGDLDNAYILRAAPALADGIRGSQRAIIHGTAHMPNMEKPEEFNRIVMTFIDSLPA